MTKVSFAADDTRQQDLPKSKGGRMFISLERALMGA